MIYMNKAFIKYIFFSSFLLSLSACKSVKSDDTELVPLLDLEYGNSPIALTVDDVKVVTDYQYASHENNRFDIFLPDSDKPTPLVIYIHGGGFTHGEKERAYRYYENEINEFLDAGFAFATIGYRFLQDTDQGVIDCMSDSKYFLQFIRYHAASFNIDPDLIGSFGQSAGAGTSLWIGLSDDMASFGTDPILEMTTRLKAIGAIATQATYDILRWEEVFSEHTIDMSRIPPVMMDQLVRFYGITDSKLIETPDLVEYRQRVDMLSLMSVDDPPIFVYNDGKDGMPLFTDPQHHPLHAKYLKQYAEKIGIDHVVYAPALGIEDKSGLTIVDFMKAELSN